VYNRIREFFPSLPVAQSADLTAGVAPLTFHFTDASTNSPTIFRERGSCSHQVFQMVEMTTMNVILRHFSRILVVPSGSFSFFDTMENRISTEPFYLAFYARG
jgi:hypothetical protein